MGYPMNTTVIQSLTNPLWKYLYSSTMSRVGDTAFNHKIDCYRKVLDILNLKGHANRITGSRVTAILLNGWI